MSKTKANTERIYVFSEATNQYGKLPQFSERPDLEGPCPICGNVHSCKVKTWKAMTLDGIEMEHRRYGLLKSREEIEKLDKEGKISEVNPISEGTKMKQAGTTEAKEKKLEHYKDRPLNDFYQYDAFLHEPGETVSSESYLNPDKDGDNIFGGSTKELMFGSDIRMLIKPGTSKEDILRILDKFKKDIKSEHSMYDLSFLERADVYCTILYSF